MPLSNELISNSGPDEKDQEGKLRIETAGEKLSLVLQNYHCATAVQVLRQTRPAQV